MAAKSLCRIDGCDKPAQGRGWCPAHYQRWRKLGDPVAPKRPKQPEFCTIDGCGKLSKGRGWCEMHLWRWRKYGDPLTLTRTPNGAPLEFLKRAFAYDGNDCLKWPFASVSGYGIIDMDDGRQVVSRIVCEEEHGHPPTPGHQAAHSCGKGHEGCCTKRHLFWKTPKENQADKLIHGTLLRGERVGSAKLSEEKVREIRALKGMLPHHEIAATFGVSQALVSMIQNGKRWAWLE